MDIRDSYKAKYEASVMAIIALDHAQQTLLKQLAVARAELVKDRDWFEREMKRDRND